MSKRHNHNHHGFHKKHRVALNKQEKDFLLTHLARFMEENPMSKDVLPGSIKEHWYTHILSHLSPPFAYQNLVPALAVLFLMLTGVVGAAAQDTLPGDALYPVKIHLNEKLKSFISIGPESQARVQAEFAERRMQEVEKLAETNMLTPEIEASVKSDFNAHIQAVNKNVEILESSGDAKAGKKVHAELKESLHVHKNKLIQLSEKKSSKGNFKSQAVLGEVIRTLENTLEDKEKESDEKKSGAIIQIKKESIRDDEDKNPPEELDSSTNESHIEKDQERSSLDVSVISTSTSVGVMLSTSTQSFDVRAEHANQASVIDIEKQEKKLKGTVKNSTE
ncbi:hypothetical protein EPO17_01190 [Patescibacteria group bacterium]|nr:MAG: hypothetical protein EPO17_01190 [Patescibacteria group bacterium]